MFLTFKNMTERAIPKDNIIFSIVITKYSFYFFQKNLNEAMHLKYQ